MNNKEVKYFVITLADSIGVAKERASWVNEMKEYIPRIEVFNAADGFNVEKIEDDFAHSGVPFVRLEHWNYGALGCWFSHYNLIKKQVDEKIPFVCAIEDDAEINETFVPSVEVLIERFSKDPELNMIRLARWSEGYITSYDSSVRILEIINKKGVVNNIDNQLRCDTGKELSIPLIHGLKCPSNFGDIGKTQKIPDDFAYQIGIKAGIIKSRLKQKQKNFTEEQLNQFSEKNEKPIN